MNTIDLNCDLGETFGPWKMGNDTEVLPLVSSCNIACGMHAGDAAVMHKTVAMAAKAGVAIGAHPGYPDLQGFGRRDMGISPEYAYELVLYQVGALAAFCKTAGVALHHVKPHGQLFNRAAVDAGLARAIARAVYDFDPALVLVGLAKGALIEAGLSTGLSVAREFFADRNYTDEGVLLSRSDPRAGIEDEDEAIARVLGVVQRGTLRSVTGKEIALEIDTICVHGDNRKALDFVTRIRAELAAAGIRIAPVGKKGMEKPA
jgi:UPF0271 protein